MRKIVTLVVCLAVATLFAMLLFYLPALAQSQLSLHNTSRTVWSASTKRTK